MVSIHLKLLHTQRSYNLKVILIAIVTILIALNYIQSSDTKFQNTLQAIETSSQHVEEYSHYADNLDDSTPRMARAKIEHLANFSKEVIAFNQALEHQDLEAYLIHHQKADELGVGVWEDNPGFNLYPQYLAKNYKISIKPALTLVDRHYHYLGRQMDYRLQHMENESFNEVLSLSPFELMGMNQFTSYFGILLFLIPVILFADVILQSKSAAKILRSLPLTPASYVRKRAITLLAEVYLLQWAALGGFYALQWGMQNVERFDLPYLFTSGSMTSEVTLLSFIPIMMLVVFLLDCCLLGIAVLGNLVLRSIVGTQLILLLMIVWETLENQFHIYLWKSGWNPLYYFDLLPALNGNKELLYQQSFGWEQLTLSAGGLCAILLLLLFLFMKYWEHRKEEQYEFLPF